MSGIESWSTTPANNNQAPPFGWPAGILPSQVEPIGRQMMTSLAAWYQAAEWINYNFTPTYIGATQFSLPGNATALYHVGRRVQATDGSTSVFGTITVSAFTTLTTVTVVWDSGVLQTGVTIVYVGITSAINSSAPITGFANPSATAGLTAVNGTAKTAMTSDSAPAISQAITPTWTGTHTFSNAITVNGAGTSLKGGVTVNAPSSGNALTANSVAGARPAIFASPNTASSSFGPSITSGTNSSDDSLVVSNAAGSRAYFQVRGDGIVFGNDGTSLIELGYKDIPQNLQTTSYGPMLADRGKGVDFNGTTLTCTIPANASVAFPIGTTIVITNLNASSLSIAITTDTLTLAGTTTTGTRTLSQNGMATIRKVTSTSWLISGSGVA